MASKSTLQEQFVMIQAVIILTPCCVLQHLVFRIVDLVIGSNTANEYESALTAAPSGAVSNTASEKKR